MNSYAFITTSATIGLCILSLKETRMVHATSVKNIRVLRPVRDDNCPPQLKYMPHLA